MTLPYRWHPLGARGKFRLEPGDILAWEHAVFRVQLVESRPNDHDEHYPVRIIIRPIEVAENDLRARDHDRALKAPASFYWQVYPNEHYPVCAQCQEPLPCRDQMAAEISTKAAENFDRYTVAGVCPACAEPVSSRQNSMTWQENVVVPFGPPVTFHLRRACWGDAMQYEQRWHSEDPSTRPRLLSCDGHITKHHDGTHECTSDACPGSEASHPAYTRCYPKYSDCSCVGAS